MEPILFQGQRLDQPTFHELYCRTPEGFRAELIEGIVHQRNGRVRQDHGRSHADLLGFLQSYKIDTPGTTGLGRVKTVLGPVSEVEPDALLLIDPDSGGLTRSDQEGPLTGVPELVVEVGGDTLSTDLNAKKRAYEKAGVAEYLVFDVAHRRFFWFSHREGRFVPLPLGRDGLFRSRVFPGLWLDTEAFLRDDARAVIATLRLGLQSPEHAGFVERLRQYRANRP